MTPQERAEFAQKYGLNDPQAGSLAASAQAGGKLTKEQALQQVKTFKDRQAQAKQAAENKPSLLKSLAGGFAKIGVTGAAALESGFDLMKGDTAAANDRLLNGYDVPGIGRVRPVGGGTVDSKTGETRYETAGENLKNTIGTGAEVAPWFMGGGAAGELAGAAESGIPALVKTGAKIGAGTGGLSAFGNSLQDDKKGVGDIAKDTAAGATTGGLLGGLTAGAGGLFSKFKASLSLPKVANKLSTIPEESMTAAMQPKTAEEIAALRNGTTPKPEIPEVPEIPQPQQSAKATVPKPGPKPGSPDDLKDIGRSAFDTANAQKTAAQEAYGSSRKAIIDANQGKVIARSKDFVTGTEDALKNEGIGVSSGKVDLTGTQFEGDEAARGPLQRVYDIMTRPPSQNGSRSVADDLLTRREALSNVINGIDPNNPNLRRVVGNMRSAFDDNLDNILGSEAGKARGAYADTMKAVNPVIDKMTKGGVFSEDNAYKFVNDALKDSKFDNTKILQDLDSVAGSAHASDVAKIEEGRTAYQKALADSAAEVNRINTQAKAEFDAAKTSRAQQISEAKRVKAVAKAAYDGKIEALKQLNDSLSKMSPEVTQNIFSVVRRRLTDLPVVGNKLTPFFSPSFWGDIALSRGLKNAANAGSGAAADTAETAASATARKAQLWVLANLIAHSSQDEGAEPSK